MKMPREFSQISSIILFFVDNYFAVYFFALVIIIGVIIFVYKLLINRQPIFERTRHIKEKEKRPVCSLVKQVFELFKIRNIQVVFQLYTPMLVFLSVCLSVDIQKRMRGFFFLKMCTLTTHYMYMKTSTWEIHID